MMIKDVIEAIAAAALRLFANWGALLISFALYAGLLFMLYLLFDKDALSLATKLGVFLHLPVAIAAILFFFSLQVMGLSYVRIGVGAGYLLKRALKHCWRLLVVSLPLALLAWLIVWGLSYAEGKLIAEAEPPRRWVELAITWGRIVWLCFVLPLIAIHSWLTAEREGLAAAFKGFLRSVGRALAPRSALIYLLVIALFSAIAYFLFFTKTPAKNEWTELWLFGARLAAALVSVFLGWFLTLGALAEMTARRAMKDL